MINQRCGHSIIHSLQPAALICEDNDPVTLLLLGTLPVAAMLVDTDRRLVQANLAARNLLDLKDGLKRAANGCVVASLPADNGRLQNLLSAFTIEMAADGRAGSTLHLWLQRPSGYAPLLLLFNPVPLSAVRSTTRKPMLLLRVLDEDRGIMGRLDPLRTAFNLTIAETRIAEQIAIGRSPNEAAEYLELSRNTVRTHLARIFDKTGVRSQQALVRLMMALGSWPTA